MARAVDPDVLLRAARALALLVRAEYPDRYSLAQIAREWGPDEGLTTADIEAVEQVYDLLTG